ncbi:uncharacterized protein SETTUDRAFT_43197 [Exserohilum turcica Et28A]|uniref:HAD-like protein n=1 Tax=Exserohilum turcicum (strain 28A) TaxID=671987 RepID=R0K4W7_EXST2|nr:uncharacterized protein SETTUDRAFT_43197 [Exserohilum turcica Et28A]EOA83397.1 hypothetical protein SETTUDRAFT_43197 [Exserohilum turcica Et28A]
MATDLVYPVCQSLTEKSFASDIEKLSLKFPTTTPSSSFTVNTETATNGTKKSKIHTLILDLGDVLFHWTGKDLQALSPQDFRAVILSSTWTELECGKVSEDKAIESIGKELSLDPNAIKQALAQCRGTVRVDQELLDQLVELKKEMNGHLKVYSMTNSSKDDFALLKATLSDWSLFDGEFTSYEAGLSKPELGYYKHVIDRIGLRDPSSAIFVDDKEVNVNAASSFGLQGMVFRSPASLIRQLRNRLSDPVTRARQYMMQNAHNHISCIENGPEFRDAFSQFLIHWELKEAQYLSLSPPGASKAEIKAVIEQASAEAKTWNYFIGDPVGTTKTFPDDIDDTATALLAFSPPAASANKVLDKIAASRHPRDNLALNYFCDGRHRVCPYVITNVVRAFYHYNRGADVKPEFEHVRRILLNRGYVDGAEAYTSADVFLYFLSCLVDANPTAPEIQSLRKPMAAALRERVGRREDSVSTTARVLACQKLGVWAQSDVQYLKELQESDGGWEIGWVCRYGRSRKRIGSRGVPTAWAIKALEFEAQHQK